MSESRRKNINFLLLILVLVGTALFYGCGGVASDRVPEPECIVSGFVKSNSRFNAVPVSESERASGQLGICEVWVESDYSNKVYTDEDGKFSIITRPGNIRLVARSLKDGKTLLAASPVFNAVKNHGVNNVKPLILREAVASLTLKVLDSNRMPKTDSEILVSVWGIPGTYDPFKGVWTTPLMPERENANINITGVGYQDMSVPSIFNKVTPIYEYSISRENEVNRAPRILRFGNLRADIPLRTELKNNDTAQRLRVEFDDPDGNIDDCVWTDDDLGEFIKIYKDPNNRYSEATWRPVKKDTVGTITVTVSDKGSPRLYSEASLGLKIGTGKTGASPRVLDLTADLSNAHGRGSVKFFADAYDTDSEPSSLRYRWNIKILGTDIYDVNRVFERTSGLNPSLNWVEYRISPLSEILDVEVSVVVTDGEGNSGEATSTFTIGADSENIVPRFTNIQLKALDGDIPEAYKPDGLGADGNYHLYTNCNVNLRAEAIDDDGDTVYYRWLVVPMGYKPADLTFDKSNRKLSFKILSEADDSLYVPDKNNGITVEGMSKFSNERVSSTKWLTPSVFDDGMGTTKQFKIYVYAFDDRSALNPGSWLSESVSVTVYPNQNKLPKYTLIVKTSDEKDKYKSGAEVRLNGEIKNGVSANIASYAFKLKATKTGDDNMPVTGIDAGWNVVKDEKNKQLKSVYYILAAAPKEGSASGIFSRPGSYTVSLEAVDDRGQNLFCETSFVINTIPTGKLTLTSPDRGVYGGAKVINPDDHFKFTYNCIDPDFGITNTEASYTVCINKSPLIDEFENGYLNKVVPDESISFDALVGDVKFGNDKGMNKFEPGKSYTIEASSNDDMGEIAATQSAVIYINTGSFVRSFDAEPAFPTEGNCYTKADTVKFSVNVGDKEDGDNKYNSVEWQYAEAKTTSWKKLVTTNNVSTDGFAMVDFSDSAYAADKDYQLRVIVTDAFGYTVECEADQGGNQPTFRLTQKQIISFNPSPAAPADPDLGIDGIKLVTNPTVITEDRSFKLRANYTGSEATYEWYYKEQSSTSWNLLGETSVLEYTVPQDAIKAGEYTIKAKAVGKFSETIETQYNMVVNSAPVVQKCEVVSPVLGDKKAYGANENITFKTTASDKEDDGAGKALKYEYSYAAVADFAENPQTWTPITGNVAQFPAGSYKIKVLVTDSMKAKVEHQSLNINVANKITVEFVGKDFDQEGVICNPTYLMNTYDKTTFRMKIKIGGIQNVSELLNGNVKDAVKFTGASVVSNGGDESAPDAIAERIYSMSRITTPATHTITVTVTDQFGITATAEHKLHVNQIPVVKSFSAVPGLTTDGKPTIYPCNQPINFEIIASDQDQNDNLTFKWFVGNEAGVTNINNQISTDKKDTFTWTPTKNGLVTLVCSITDIRGEKVEQKEEIKVADPIDMVFQGDGNAINPTYRKSTENSEVVFQVKINNRTLADFASDATGLTNIKWERLDEKNTPVTIIGTQNNSNDGNGCLLKLTASAITAPQTYKIRLSVTDEFGQSGSIISSEDKVKPFTFRVDAEPNFAKPLTLTPQRDSYNLNTPIKVEAEVEDADKGEAITFNWSLLKKDNGGEFQPTAFKFGPAKINDGQNPKKHSIEIPGSEFATEGIYQIKCTASDEKNIVTKTFEPIRVADSITMLFDNGSDVSVNPTYRTSNDSAKVTFRVKVNNRNLNDFASNENGLTNIQWERINSKGDVTKIVGTQNNANNAGDCFLSITENSIAMPEKYKVRLTVNDIYGQSGVVSSDFLLHVDEIPEFAGDLTITPKPKDNRYDPNSAIQITARVNDRDKSEKITFNWELFRKVPPSTTYETTNFKYGPDEVNDGQNEQRTSVFQIPAAQLTNEGYYQVKCSVTDGKNSVEHTTADILVNQLPTLDGIKINSPTSNVVNKFSAEPIFASSSPQKFVFGLDNAQDLVPIPGENTKWTIAGDPNETTGDTYTKLLSNNTTVNVETSDDYGAKVSAQKKLYVWKYGNVDGGSSVNNSVKDMLFDANNRKLYLVNGGTGVNTLNVHMYDFNFGASPSVVENKVYKYAKEEIGPTYSNVDLTVQAAAVTKGGRVVIYGQHIDDTTDRLYDYKNVNSTEPETVYKNVLKKSVGAALVNVTGLAYPDNDTTSAYAVAQTVSAPGEQSIFKITGLAGAEVTASEAKKYNTEALGHIRCYGDVPFLAVKGGNRIAELTSDLKAENKIWNVTSPVDVAVGKDYLFVLSNNTAKAELVIIEKKRTSDIVTGDNLTKVDLGLTTNAKSIALFKDNNEGTIVAILDETDIKFLSLGKHFDNKQDW